MVFIRVLNIRCYRTFLHSICVTYANVFDYKNSGPNGHTAQLQFVKRGVSSEQMCYNIPMGDLMTSGALHVGHNDLDQPMLVDHTEANKNTLITS